MKICTMNCGPALGDTRTAEERRANCDDCDTVCPDSRNFIVVIGRAHGDDEDHARSYGDMPVSEAEEAVAAYRAAEKMLHITKGE